MELRIDELALRTGTTSRNIRAYQARGLLPPPRLRGRTGYYGEEHLRRLELVRELQERGFSLEAIRQTLDAWTRGGDLGDLLGIRQLIAEPWVEGEPVTLTRVDLESRFPEIRERPELLERGVEEGLLVQAPDGRYEGVRILLDAGAELVRAGMSLEEIFELVAAIRANTRAIAERFVQIVAQRLIDPVIAGTVTPGDVHETTQRVVRLRTLAIDVVRPFLAQAFAAASEAALEDVRHRVEQPEASAR